MIYKVSKLLSLLYPKATLLSVCPYLSRMSILFEDRIDAAYKLAQEIESYLKNEQKDITFSNTELIVLAIPRGGYHTC